MEKTVNNLWREWYRNEFAYGSDIRYGQKLFGANLFNKNIHQVQSMRFIELKIAIRRVVSTQ